MTNKLLGDRNDPGIGIISGTTVGLCKVGDVLVCDENYKIVRKTRQRYQTHMGLLIPWHNHELA